MPTGPSDKLLAAGLLNICKHLLGRVRVLEEMVNADPATAARWQEAKRFQAAFEEDEYEGLKRLLRDALTALEDSDVTSAEVPLPAESVEETVG